MILAKDRNVSVEFHDQNKHHDIEKTYLARVSGDYPETLTVIDKPIYCKSFKDGIFAVCEDDEDVKEKLKAKDSET